jgi:hypothetical protein
MGIQPSSLGGNVDLFLMPSPQLRQQSFTSTIPIHVCGVEEVHPELYRAMQGR